MDKKTEPTKPPGSFDPREIEAKNVSGSIAGAGSGDFHVYRKSRRIELDRIENMEKEAREKKERDVALMEALERRMKEEKRTEKRAAKRRRKKELRVNRKQNRGGDNGNSSRAMNEQVDTTEKVVVPQNNVATPE